MNTVNLLRLCGCGALATALLAGCSTDALELPQPTLYTPGAFTAVDEENGRITLYRTLDTLELETDTLLFLTEYEANPADYDEARELAKDPALPLRVASVGASANLFPGHPYQVVWFRTLTTAERERGE